MLMFVLALLVAKLQLDYAQRVDAASPRIIPSSLQYFEYKPVSFTCDGFDGPSRVRNKKEFIPTCSEDKNTLAVQCTIDGAFTTDSGEYWCEGEDGRRSNTVNITVTAGSVILESPVLPVMEGGAVTLHCQHKNRTPNPPANFYKDGLLAGSGGKGQLTIHNVSKADEGFYSCSMKGSGKSAGSRLTVQLSNHQEEETTTWIHEGPFKDLQTAGSVILESPALPVMEGDAVTLRCRHRKTSFNLPADFYKDDVLIRSSLRGDMSILNVSASDEGLYRCRISGFGGSAASRLTVRPLPTEALPSHGLFLLLWLAIVTLVVLLLVVIGLLHYIKKTVSAEGDRKAEARLEPCTLS